MDVTQWRAAVCAAAATAEVGGDWPDRAVDAGLRAALVELTAAHPPVEVDYVVTVPGRVQDVSALPDLGEIAAVAWPWTFTAVFARAAVAFEQQGAVITLARGVPLPGDVIRLRHWRVWRIGELDGAPATTVPAALRPLVVTGAMAHMVLLHARALEHGPGPARLVRRLLDVAHAGLLAYREGLGRLGE